MLTQRPVSCEGCPLHTKSVLGFCPDKLVPEPEFVVYGEAPGKNELLASEPFVGDAGFVLKQWLMRAVPRMQLASERNTISYQNVLHCLPPMTHGRPYPTGKERVDAEAHCAVHRHEIEAPTVILCGEIPQRHVFGPEMDAEDASDRRLGRDVKGVMGRIGREIVKEGRRYVFAPHPAFVLRSPALVEHGQRALQIAANTERTLDVDYVKWETAMTVFSEQKIYTEA